MRKFFVQKNSSQRSTAKRLTAFAVFACAGLILSAFATVLHAQTAADPVATQCNALLQSATASQFADATSKQSQCKAYIELVNQLAQSQQSLKSQQGQSQTISSAVTQLKAKINQAQLDIKAKNFVIQTLTGDISDKSDQIQTLAEKISNEKDSLGQILRNANGLDRSSLIDLVLSNNSISQFYNDLNSYDSIQSSIKNSVDEISGLKSQTETAKTLLQQKQDQELNAKHTIEQNKAQIEKNQAQQAQLLSISKDKEKAYQKVIVDQQARVAQIKAKLFSLAGGEKAIPFGDALQYARTASASTKVDPAFVLAILTQESNLGSNVGKCYLTVPDTGAGVNVTSGKTYPNVMKPTRDVGPFIQITQSLGIDPFKQVVSCPIAGAGGYGGAMGPAQFIASTWNLFIKRLQIALGETTPNPWAPQDAFMASAMYLGDLGGINANYAAELRAACKYYGTGGATCAYGKSVMKLADSIQTDIDYLNQYGVTKSGK